MIRGFEFKSIVDSEIPPPEVETGLDYPLNGVEGPILQWADPPDRLLSTCIYDVLIHEDIGYRMWWYFHHNGYPDDDPLGPDAWDYGSYDVIFTTYPGGDGSVNEDGNATDPDVSDPNQYMEIAGGGAANDRIATAGTTDVYQVNSQFGTWVKQAWTIRQVEIESIDYIEHTLYVDLSDPSDTIVLLEPLSQFEAEYGPPPNPLLVLGSAKWRKGFWDENSGSVFRNMQLYSGVCMSPSDIVTESNGTNPTTPVTTDGQAYVYYRNLNPTPDDVTDKSGQGNDPTWDGSARPELWEE